MVKNEWKINDTGAIYRGHSFIFVTDILYSV